MEYYDDAFDGETLYCACCGIGITEPSTECNIVDDILCDSCIIDVKDYFNTVVTPVLDEVKKIKKVD